MYLIEYSVKERAFHVEPMADRMNKNMNLAMAGVSKDYQAVGLAVTRVQADEQINQIKKNLNEGIGINAN